MWKIGAWVDGCREVADVRVAPELENAKMVGCVLTPMVGVRRVAHSEGLRAGRAALKELAADSVVGLPTDVDCSDFELAASTRVLLFCMRHNLQLLIVLLMWLKNAKTREA